MTSTFIILLVCISLLVSPSVLGLRPNWTGSYFINQSCSETPTCCCAPLNSTATISESGNVVTLDTRLLGTLPCGNLTQVEVKINITSYDSFLATGQLGPISLNCTLSSNSLIFTCTNQFGCTAAGYCVSGPNCPLGSSTTTTASSTSATANTNETASTRGSAFFSLLCILVLLFSLSMFA